MSEFDPPRAKWRGATRFGVFVGRFYNIYMTYPNTDYEIEIWSKGGLACGIDEVGRGCVAGPVVAASVVMPKSHKPIDGIRDSKKISQKKHIRRKKQTRQKKQIRQKKNQKYVLFVYWI